MTDKYLPRDPYIKNFAQKKLWKKSIKTYMLVPLQTSTHSVMDLNEQHQKVSSEETDQQPLTNTQTSTEQLLQELLKKLVDLEMRVLSLERPQLMYKRPTAEAHEKLSDTLDYLHNNVESLKRDLLRVAKAV